MDHELKPKLKFNPHLTMDVIKAGLLEIMLAFQLQQLTWKNVTYRKARNNSGVLLNESTLFQISVKRTSQSRSLQHLAETLLFQRD